MSGANEKRRKTVITDYLLEGKAKKNGELGGKKSEKCS